MVDEAHRVARTIDDLLELSRIELGGAAAKDVVAVAQVIDDAVERAQAAAEHHAVEVIVDNGPGDLHVVGSHRQLVSAVANLLENAVKYTDAGSEVVVESRRDDGWIEIVVTDTGIGIPARDLDRIFERFYRVDRARSRDTGGTGLGLAIVRHVATNHGGEVTVQSREGEGSTSSRIRVPSARDHRGNHDAATCRSRRRGRASFVEALDVGLDPRGLPRRRRSTDGVEALQRFDERAARPRAARRDAAEAQGIDVCRQLRKRSQVPIIMVTAKGAEIDTVVGLEVGADDYVTKPYRLRELVARMRAVLRRAPGDAAAASELSPGSLAVGDVVLDPDEHRGHDRRRGRRAAAEGVRAAAPAAGQRRPGAAARDA